MRYLYYKLYKLLVRIKSNKTPAFNSMIILSVFQIMNILSIFILIKHFIQNTFDTNLEDARNHGVILALLVFIFNYFFLFNKQKEIFKRYENESYVKSRKGFLQLIIYVLGSFIVLLLFGEIFLK